MFRYLKENKHWIFSGIGVFAISLIISSFIRFANTGNQLKEDTALKPPKENQLKGETALKPFKMSDPTPLHIADTIRRLPPLQGADLAKSYEGVKVDWELEFRDASKNQFKWQGRDKTKHEVYIDIYFKIPGQPFSDTAIWCKEVKLSNYPEFKIMVPGRIVRVEGIIDRISQRVAIDIKDVVFSFQSTQQMKYEWERGDARNGPVLAPANPLP